MASDKVQHLTDGNFAATIQNAAVPVLVDFWADWCGPCKRLGPTVDALADELGGQAIVAKVNVDQSPVTPSQFGVRGIPTVILFKGGQVVDQVVGVVSKDELKQMVQKHI